MRLCRILRRFQSLRQNVFFGIVPRPGDKRRGPPRDQCHSERAIAQARGGFVHVDELATRGCEGDYAWDTHLLAYQVRSTPAHTARRWPTLTQCQ